MNVLNLQLWIVQHTFTDVILRQFFPFKAGTHQPDIKDLAVTKADCCVAMSPVFGSKRLQSSIN